jgi:DnaJ-class molecular chaperone
MTHYDTLELKPSASPDEIKKQFRLLSIKWHPDKNPDKREEATRRFQEINRAYKILGDQERRSVYDKHGDRGIEMLDQGINPDTVAQHGAFPFAGFPGGFPFFGGGGMGGGARPKGPRRSPNTTFNLAVTMSDLYTGATHRFDVPYKVGCSSCEGTGSSSKKTEKCPTCNGQGRRILRRAFGPMVQQQEVDCDQCQSEGVICDRSCETCKGNRWVIAQRQIEFTVYPGMEYGMSIGVPGKGDELWDHIPGDLHVILGPPSPTPTPTTWERAGPHLIYHIDVPLVNALTGLRTTIMHPGIGRQIAFELNEVITPDSVYRAAHMGMPNLNQGAVSRQIPLAELPPTTYGDICLKFNVIFPSKIQPKGAEVLRHVLGPGLEAAPADIETMKIEQVGEEDEDETANEGPSGPNGPQFGGGIPPEMASRVQCAQQ